MEQHMRLYEFLEDAFTPPGITYTLNNDPQTAAAVSPNADIGASQTANVAPINGTVQTPVNGGPQQPNMPNPAAMNLAKQQLQIGANRMLRVGPGNQGGAEQPFTVTGISNNNSAIKGQEAVTLANKNHPNQPQVTYPLSALVRK